MGLTSSKVEEDTGPYFPTSLEVRMTRLILTRKVPIEIALQILNQAEYGPMIRYKLDRPMIVRSVGPKIGLRLIRSQPLPRGSTEAHIRRITITTDSRDQGFSSTPVHNGTRVSHSWFEAILLRRDPDAQPLQETEDPLPEDETVIHQVETVKNIHAGRDYVSAKVIFEVGDELVDLARAGDFIELWSFAHYPAWANDVKDAILEIEYSV